MTKTCILVRKTAAPHLSPALVTIPPVALPSPTAPPLPLPSQCVDAEGPRSVPYVAIGIFVVVAGLLVLALRNIPALEGTSPKPRSVQIC